MADRMTEVRCIVCGRQWSIDYEPPKCTCADGGLWQIRVEGGEWSEARDSQGEEH